MGRTTPSPSLGAQGQPPLLYVSTPDPAARHWDGPARHRSPGGATGDVPSPVQAPQRANQGPSFLVLLRSRAQPLWSAPSHGKRVLTAGGEFSVIPIMGSSITGAASACEKVSCVNSQCRRDVGVLTLYSLSCPWMVSRCTRVQVRATAVLFKTLILTSVGAALGSESSGIKQSVR